MDDQILLMLDNTEPVLNKILDIVGTYRNVPSKLKKYITTGCREDFVSAGDLVQYECLNNALTEMRIKYRYSEWNYWQILTGYYQRKYEEIKQHIVVGKCKRKQLYKKADSSIKSDTKLDYR